MTQAPIYLDQRFADGLQFALALHAHQRRKGSDVPYFAHLLSVTALVIEDGGDLDQAIAALLHDAVEDQGGLETLQSIEANFGPHVAEIVAGCSDSFEKPKPPWRQRKQAYLEQLHTASQAVLRVSMADKLHNLRSIYRDYLREGEGLWPRFKGGREGTLWYYQAVLRIFRARSKSSMVAEIDHVLSRLMQILA